MCDVYRFQCNKAEDHDFVSRLTKIATKQRHYFYEIYPWNARCKENWQMFIAMKEDTDPRTRGGITICAWCSVRYEELERRTGERIKAAYIVEVSVRRKKEEGAVDENYKGMGITLLNKIIEYSQKHGTAMIYLVPSNESVKGLYKSSPSLQMSEVENTSYLVKSLTESVSLEQMREIITLKRENEIAEEQEIYEEGLRELPTKIREKFIEMVDAAKMNLDDKIALLGEQLIMLDEGGGV